MASMQCQRTCHETCETKCHDTSFAHKVNHQPHYPPSTQPLCYGQSQSNHNTTHCATKPNPCHGHTSHTGHGQSTHSVTKPNPYHGHTSHPSHGQSTHTSHTSHNGHGQSIQCVTKPNPCHGQTSQGHKHHNGQNCSSASHVVASSCHEKMITKTKCGSQHRKKKDCNKHTDGNGSCSDSSDSDCD